MSQITFRELSPLDAERQLAGRCLSDERLLRRCLELLPLNCWRSNEGHDLSRIFYALVGRLNRGAFNPETNEDDLAAGFGAVEPDRAWSDYLDGLWSPWMAVQQYADGLLDSLLWMYRWADDDIAHKRRLDQAPLAIDTAFEDDIWFHVRDVVARRRTERHRKTNQDAAPPPASSSPRGVLDAFKR